MPARIALELREPAGEIADDARLLRLDVGEPACETFCGFVGRERMRSVHKTRGQTRSVRVALRG